MKRQRGRGRKPGGGNPGNRPHESNGPEVKIRGTAAQIYDKYMQYARDAHSSGDRVKYENFLQHAEHYFRIMAATMPRERLQAAQDAGGFGGAAFGATGGNGSDDLVGDDAPANGLKVMDDLSDEDGTDSVEAEAGEEEFEGFEPQQEERTDARGEGEGRGRRRRGRRRRPDGPPGERGGGQGPDTEARSALDALAQRQAAVAGS